MAEDAHLHPQASVGMPGTFELEQPIRGSSEVLESVTVKGAKRSVRADRDFMPVASVHCASLHSSLTLEWLPEALVFHTRVGMQLKPFKPRQLGLKRQQQRCLQGCG